MGQLRRFRLRAPQEKGKDAAEEATPPEFNIGGVIPKATDRRMWNFSLEKLIRFGLPAVATGLVMLSLGSNEGQIDEKLVDEFLKRYHQA